MERQRAIDMAVRGGFRLESAAALKPWQPEKIVRALAEHAAGGFGTINGDPMGLGKTRSGIAVMCAAFGTSGTGGGIFAVPARTIPNWLREIREHTTLRAVDWAALTGAQRASMCLGRERVVVVMSHDSLRNAFSEAYEKVPRKPFEPVPESVFDAWMLKGGAHRGIFETPLAGLIIDEIHILRNQKTIQFAAAAHVSRRANIVNGLTGTVLQNSISDLVSVSRLVKARPEFCRHETFEGLVKCQMLKRLHATTFVRTTQKPELPPLVTKHMMLDMPPDELEFMKKTVEKCVQVLLQFETKTAEQKVTYASVLKHFMRIRQASVCAALVRPDRDPDADDEATEDPGRLERVLAILGCMSAKLNAALGCVEELLKEDRKVVVFCHFVDPLFALQSALEDRDIKSAILHGGLSRADQEAAVAQFEADPTANVLFVSTKCGGTGLNLQVASAAVHLDVWWNPSAAHQATGRIYRMGQTRDCVVVHIGYRASFDDTCTDLYCAFKDLNAEKLYAAQSVSDTDTSFDSHAAKKLLKELTVRLDMAEQVATMQKIRRADEPLRAAVREGADQKLRRQLREAKKKVLEATAGPKAPLKLQLNLTKQRQLAAVAAAARNRMERERVLAEARLRVATPQLLDGDMFG